MAGTTSPNPAQLESIVGADRVRAPTARETRTAKVIVEPASVEELCEIVCVCETDRIAIAPVGAARTLAQIRRMPVAVGISMARLNRLVAYEPDDMTIVAESGITVGGLNNAIVPSGQRLPVDPCDPAITTLGALIGASRAGPLRLSEGTSRDLLIGVRFVGHGGKLIHAGGRVVKNVAGYDLMKLMVGSFGTLGIVTEATFKVRPIPTGYRLAVLPYTKLEAAFAAARILNDALPLSNLDILSPALAMQFNSTTQYLVLAGFSGGTLEIGYQSERIRALLGLSGEILHGDAAREHYETLRDIDFYSRPLSAQIAAPPALLPRALQDCAAEFRAHAGAGVAQIFLVEQPTPETAAKAVVRWREIAHSARGHLRLIAAAPAIRDALEFFDTPNDGALKLMRRLKAAFDPARIFNPGCFVGGI